MVDYYPIPIFLPLEVLHNHHGELEVEEHIHHGELEVELHSHYGELLGEEGNPQNTEPSVV